MSKIVQFKDKTTGEEIYPSIDDTSTLIKIREIDKNLGIINSSVREIASALDEALDETPSLSYSLGADSSHFYVIKTKDSSGAMLLGNDYYMQVGGLNNYQTMFNSSVVHVYEVIKKLWNSVITN